MRITFKSVLLGMPLLMVAVIGAVLAMWMTGMIGGGGGVLGGPSSVAGISWNVEYWHRNAEGELLEYKKSHNTVTEQGKNAAMAHLLNVGVTASGQVSETFDQIVLMNADHTIDTTSAVIDSKILLLVAGAAGSGPVGDGPTIHLNPVSGTFTDTGTLDGDGKITVIFKGATGNPVAATQMMLVKTVEDDSAADAGGADGAGGGGIDTDTNRADIQAADILAVIEITVDLAATDTLQIDWTIDID